MAAQEDFEFDGGEVIDDRPMRVHFRVVEADEGEHNNVKDSDNLERKFRPYAENPVEIDEDGELVVNFECIFQRSTEYIYDSEMEKRLKGVYGTSVGKNDLEPLAAAQVVFDHLDELEDLDPAYEQLLTFVPPPNLKATPPILATYINKFSAKNNMDFFIHKDLGGFLRRELDFYIKNEIMRLDDIESAEAPRVESYLNKLKAIRKVAHNLIDFLAQLENFQKKLWLKKKFVVETNYCVTLNLVPKKLYPEIIRNKEQVQAWIELFAIDEMVGDEYRVPFAMPLTEEFLEVNDKLVLDTRFFGDTFKAKLLTSVEGGIEQRCDGTLVHSENFQGLQLLQSRYRESVRTTYIDPPYNTAASSITYKNGYKSSSWTAMLCDRLAATGPLLCKDGVLAASIDDVQQRELSFLLSSEFQDNMLGTICVRSNPSGRPMQTGYSVSHEYLLLAGKSKASSIGRMQPTEDQLSRFSEEDEKGRFEWRNLRREGSDSDRSSRPRMFYPLIIKGDAVRVPQMSWDSSKDEWQIEESLSPGEQVVLPTNERGEEKRWRWSHETVQESLSELAVRKDRSGRDYVYYKRRPNSDGVACISSWFDAKYSATEHGTAVIKDLFGGAPFSYPKSIHTVRDALYVSGASEPNVLVLDYFAGSGTTGQAVIDLNREDGGRRKYILIEMGQYFDTVLKPRIQKVVYSKDWKGGKPTSRDTGITHCFKYIRLESYEDTLNSLEFQRDEQREKVLAADSQLREDYLLHYMLDIESKHSPSLLNVDEFADPTSYKLKVKKPGSLAKEETNVDLLETFNYLIGLRVEHIAAPETFEANLHRPEDPELPEDQHTKLVVDGKIEQSEDGAWWFRSVTGWVPTDPMNPDNGERENVLIIWRKLTGDIEKDNAVLDAYVEKKRINPQDFEFDVIYVNGSNNLPNLRREDESWKVRLLEEEFMNRMWDIEDV